MAKQTMYSRYCDLTLPFEIITGYEFFRLPYHVRLRMAGLKIILKKQVSCTQLLHHPVGVPLDLPDLSESLTECRKGDVYFKGLDGELYPVYPFEFDIVW